jgi:hypothetical protein
VKTWGTKSVPRPRAARRVVHVLEASVQIGAVVAALGAGLVGCGSAPPPPSTTIGAAAEVAELVLLLETEGQGTTAEAVGSAVQSALVTSGYKVVVEPAAAHDATALLKVTTTEEPSFIQVKVNGRIRKSYRVDASLAIVADGRVVEQTSAQFSASEGEVNSDAVASLVAGLGQSTRLTRFAAEYKQRGAERVAREERERAEATARAARERADAEQRRAAEEERVQKEAGAQDDAAWVAANMAGCMSPSTLASCEGVRTYLEKLPRGRHATEAQQALAAAEPRLAALRDELAWKAGNPDRCKDPVESTDCLAVDDYLTKYPTGNHADEARALVNNSRRKILALAAQEDVKARRVQEAFERQEKQQKREECRKECKEIYCAGYGAPKFDLCVSACAQRRCD